MTEIYIPKKRRDTTRDTVGITFRLEPHTANYLRNLANKRNMSMNLMIAEIIESHRKRNKGTA